MASHRDGRERGRSHRRPANPPGHGPGGQHQARLPAGRRAGVRLLRPPRPACQGPPGGPPRHRDRQDRRLPAALRATPGRRGVRPRLPPRPGRPRHRAGDAPGGPRRGAPGRGVPAPQPARGRGARRQAARGRGPGQAPGGPPHGPGAGRADPARPAPPSTSPGARRWAPTSGRGTCAGWPTAPTCSRGWTSRWRCSRSGSPAPLPWRRLPTRDKARRVAGDQTIPGWRPAPGQDIPRRESWALRREARRGGLRRGLAGPPQEDPRPGGVQVLLRGGAPARPQARGDPVPAAQGGPGRPPRHRPRARLELRRAAVLPGVRVHGRRQPAGLGGRRRAVSRPSLSQRASSSPPRPPRRSPPPTPWGSCTRTSSRPTSWSPRDPTGRPRPSSPTSASAWSPTPRASPSTASRCPA